MKIADELIPMFLIDVMEDGDPTPSSSTISQNNLGRVLPVQFPSNKDKSKFIQKRKKLIEPYKDFRKSKNAEKGWRTARYNHLKGIRDFSKCLTGDTKISLLNGTEVAIKDLVGLEEFYVYSMDLHTNRIVPGRATNCKLTRSNTPIVKVTFIDKEGSIQSERCTPDHPWLLTNGRYVEAANLKPGDSLSSLYRRVKNSKGEYVTLDKYPRGYEELLQPCGKWEETYRVVFNWKYGNTLCNAKMNVAHHKTFNSRDNSPNVLVACTRLWHHNYHIKHNLIINDMLYNPNNPRYLDYEDSRKQGKAKLKIIMKRRVALGLHVFQTKKHIRMLSKLNRDLAKKGKHFSQTLEHRKRMSEVQSALGKSGKHHSQTREDRERVRLEQLKRVEIGSHQFLSDNFILKRVWDKNNPLYNEYEDFRIRFRKTASETIKRNIDVMYNPNNPAFSLEHYEKHRINNRKAQNLLVKNGKHVFITNNPMSDSRQKRYCYAVKMENSARRHGFEDNEHAVKVVNQLYDKLPCIKYVAKELNCSPEFVKKRLLDYKDSVKSRKYRYGIRVEENVKKFGFENNEHAIKAIKDIYNKLGSIKYTANEIGCSPNFIRKRLAQAHLNHNVISVELDGIEDTYDFTVDTYHNFALSSGVFVHNSLEGKKFHRKLGKWLVDREPGHFLDRFESSDLVSALSSFRTHILLELNYYKPFSEEVDFFNAVEAIIKLVDGYSAEILESVYSYSEFLIKEDLYDNIIRILEPAGIIHSFALTSGKSEVEVEKLWREAQDVVKKEYNKGEDDEGFWALVTGTLKKMLGITGDDGGKVNE